MNFGRFRVSRSAVFAKLATLVLAFGANSMVQAQAPQISPDRFQVSADGQEVIDQEKQLVRSEERRVGKECA